MQQSNWKWDLLTNFLNATHLTLFIFMQKSTSLLQEFLSAESTKWVSVYILYYYSKVCNLMWKTQKW